MNRIKCMKFRFLKTFNKWKGYNKYQDILIPIIDSEKEYLTK